MTEFIGAGEITTKEIAQSLLPSYYTIEQQVPISKLVSKEDFENFANDWKKHKADIAVWVWDHSEKKFGNQKYIGVIRVQGKDHYSGKSGQQHEKKSRKDTLMKSVFKANGLWVVDISYLECKEIFKEVPSYGWSFDAVIEFCEMFKMAKVKRNKI